MLPYLDEYIKTLDMTDKKCRDSVSILKKIDNEDETIMDMSFEYLKSLCASNSEVTETRRKTDIRRYLTFLQEQHNIDISELFFQIGDMKFHEISSDTYIMSPEDLVKSLSRDVKISVDKGFEEFNQDYLSALWILMYYGVEIEECLTIRKSDVNTNDSTVYIPYRKEKIEIIPTAITLIDNLISWNTVGIKSIKGSYLFSTTRSEIPTSDATYKKNAKGKLSRSNVKKCGKFYRIWEWEQKHGILQTNMTEWEHFFGRNSVEGTEYREWRDYKIANNL